MVFCILGPIWPPKACLATWDRFTPFPHVHAYRENQPIFQNMGFPCNPSLIMCRWSPQDRWAPPEHPQDTSSAPPSSYRRLPIRPVSAVLRLLRKLIAASEEITQEPVTLAGTLGKTCLFFYPSSACIFIFGALKVELGTKIGSFMRMA